MGRSIIKLGEFYLMWSSIVDAPVTAGMDLCDFKRYYQFEHGYSGMQLLESRLERVEAKGTSSHTYVSVDEQVEFNRAGPNETDLTKDEIYRAFCLQEPVHGHRLDDFGNWYPVQDA